MALIDELKEKQARIRSEHQESRNKQDAVHREMDEQFLALNDLARAIAALEAPAQPVHPEAELRSVPGAEEESRDQFEASAGQTEEAAVTAFSACDDQSDGVRALPGGVEESRDHSHIVEDDWTPTVQPAEITVADLDKLVSKVSPAERAEMESDAPEIPEEFTKWYGGGFVVFCKQYPARDGMLIEVLFRNGERCTGEPAGFAWDTAKELLASGWKHEDAVGGKITDTDDIIAYRILEAPAPAQDASEAINDLVDELVGDITVTADTVAMQTYMDGDQVVIREISAEEMYAPPPTDLWQQGYDDKANGYDPSLAEPEYTKGYEARALIEREHRETMERAKFFDGGMMADADRHQSDQRGIVGAIAGMFKREPA